MQCISDSVFKWLTNPFRIENPDTQCGRVSNSTERGRGGCLDMMTMKREMRKRLMMAVGGALLLVGKALWVVCGT